jgi:hydroxymethylbilane synthase
MTTLPERVAIATRGSRLARAQATIVAGLVRGAHPNIEVTIAILSTAGDRDTRPFGAIGAKGLFTSEVEREVVERRADVAVHSAKDLTAQLAPGCALVCMPARAPVADVVLGGAGEDGSQRLASLPPGARVGTSSMRRRVLLAEARPDLEAVELRGNLDTRIAKVERGDLGAAIVAAAGLVRLGRAELAARASLDPAWWVPAPAQGALAVEALEERADLGALFGPVTDPVCAAEVTCERAFAARLEGGCSVPLGCRAEVVDERLVVRGFLGAPGGHAGLRDRISGPVSEAAALGIELAEALLGAGGDDILADIAAAGIVQPSPP